MADTLFELEHAYDRADLAAIFREFADSLEAETAVELHTPTRHLSVDVPPRVVAELEVEHEDAVTELGFDLEWDDPEGTSVRVSDADPEPESGTDDAESAVDPATATMPPDAITRDAESMSGDSEHATTTGSERRSRFEIYRDRADEWRWRLVHWNGNIIADSGEGYASRSNAERAARGVMRNAPTARIEHQDRDRDQDA